MVIPGKGPFDPPPYGRVGHGDQRPQSILWAPNFCAKSLTRSAQTVRGKKICFRPEEARPLDGVAKHGT